MPPFPTWFLPFVTRDMLDGHQGNTYGIRFKMWANGVHTLKFTGLTKAGTISGQFITVGTTLTETFNLALSELPIFFSVLGADMLVQTDQCFVRAVLTVNGDEVYTLTSGYVNANRSLSWPQDSNSDAKEGRGLLTMLTATDPAANTEITVTPPTGSLWLLRSLKFTLVTDANVATRDVVIVIQQGSTTIVRIPAAVTQIASLTRIYNYWVGAPFQGDATSTIVTAPLPDNILIGDGWSIKTITANMQATDNWGLPVIGAEVFMEAVT